MLTRRHSIANSLVEASGQGMAQLGRSAFLVGLVATVLLSYVAMLFRVGPDAATMVVVGACLFVACLVYLEFGLVLTLMAMLLSPEVELTGMGIANMRLRAEDLLLPLVLLAALGRKALLVDRRGLARDRMTGLLFAFVMVQVIASARGWSHDIIQPSDAGMVILKQIQFFSIFYLLWQYTHTLLRARNLLTVALLTGLITAVYNVFQIPTNEVWTRNRISAPFEGSPEPSSIGGYFVIVLAITLALLLEAENPRHRILLAVACVVVFVPFLYTLSRTSYVAFLLTVLILTLLTRNRFLAAGLLIGLLGSPWLLPESVIERVLYTFNDHIKILGVFDRSLGERIYIWYKVYWSMLGRPLLGHGVTYHQVIDSYYARVLIETGLIGLAAFLFVVSRLLVVAHRVRINATNWWVRGLALGYSAALIGLLLHGFSAITFLIVRIMEPFWALTGVLFGLHTQMVDASSPTTTMASGTQLNPGEIHD